MKTQLKNSLIKLALLLSAATACMFALAGCWKCGGCDEIVQTSGASLGVSQSADFLDSRYINIVEITVIQDGDRKCYNKDLVVCPNDALVLDKLNLVCNKDLDLTTLNVAAGRDLLEIESLYINNVGSQELPIIGIVPSDNFSKEEYTFYLSGSTADGKKIADTLVIDWR